MQSTITTCMQLARIRKIQGAFSVLTMLHLSAFLYPQDAKICDGNTYDYVVVGGGTTGLVVAARLVEANYSVLIIEAGGNYNINSGYPGFVTYLKNTSVDWKFTEEIDSSIGQCVKPGGSTLYGKVLGGSGATNFMTYGRGNPRDYEKFADASGDSSWKWENMLKYFKKSENLRATAVLNSPYKKFHGTDGNIDVTKENRPECDDYLQAFKESGETVVTDNIGTGELGYSSALYHIGQYRENSAKSYLPPLKDNPNLHITRNSLATKILFKGKVAVGVEFVKNGKTITVHADKEVIVSAGAIKSPQLLMLSGIGPKQELESMKIDVISNLPVGKNLQNVVGTVLGFKTNRPANPQPFNAHLVPAPLVVGYSALNKSSTYPEYETLNFIIDNYKYLLQLCGFTFRFKTSVSDNFKILANNSQVLVTIVSNINHPKSQGEVKLSSTNPFDQPKIIRGYFNNKDDLENLVDYIMDYIKTLDSRYFKKLGVEFMDVLGGCGRCGKRGSRDYWRCYAKCMISVTGRNCGTCAMGSVVDSKLLVYGVERLRVVDPSAMPNTVGSAIFASAVAFAEKGAEMIIESA